MTKIEAQNIFDKYYNLLEYIQKYYASGDYTKSEKYCIESIKMFPKFLEAIACVDDTIPHIPAFEKLAKIYEKQQRYNEAISVCELALSYGLNDGTKGGYEGRIVRLRKNKDNPKSTMDLERKLLPTTEPSPTEVELIKKYAVNLGWYICISFRQSTSKNFETAIFLARQANYFCEEKINGESVFQAYYSNLPNDYLKFIQLYELVSDWKSCFIVLNGKIMDRKVVGGLNYCYGDKCRSGRSDFCFGASEMTSNPFGCHRLQISLVNNPWWTFSSRRGNSLYIDKQRIKHRIDEYCQPYLQCPDFDYNQIMERLNALPDRIEAKDLPYWETWTPTSKNNSIRSACNNNSVQHSSNNNATWNTLNVNNNKKLDSKNTLTSLIKKLFK